MFAHCVGLFSLLRFLCLRKILTATKCFQTYTKEHPHVEKGPPFVKPLLNFLWFLLVAVERYAVFGAIQAQTDE